MNDSFVRNNRELNIFQLRYQQLSIVDHSCKCEDKSKDHQENLDIDQRNSQYTRNMNIHKNVFVDMIQRSNLL